MIIDKDRLESIATGKIRTSFTALINGEGRTSGFQLDEIDTNKITIKDIDEALIKANRTFAMELKQKELR